MNGAPITSSDQLPLVLGEEHICALFDISPRTLARQLRAKVFPIAELPRISKAHRWSRADVLSYLENPGVRVRQRGRDGDRRGLKVVPHAGSLPHSAKGR